MSLARAIATGDLAELPGRRDEDWRWSDLRGLVRALPAASPAGDAAALGVGPFGAIEGDEIVFLNGRRIAGEGALTIAAGAPRTLRLRFVSDAAAGSHQAALAIALAPNAILTLLESHEGLGEGYVEAVSLDIDIGPGARLERLVLAADAPDAVSVTIADIDLAPGAQFAQTILTHGARRQRQETRVRHGGQGARLRLDGAYRLSGPRHADLTSEVIHAAPGGSTSQLAKGAVEGPARAVFQGRIIVREGADQTDARMGHHALLLSDRAEVDAKPELEIYADDVSCSHGNSIGALDEAALFYAQARGLPEAEARAMLTEAFIGEVVDRIEHDDAREIARAWLAGS